MQRGDEWSDGGFSLVELLIVIVILGILATAVVFAVRGIVDDGDEAACKSESHILATAVESYFAQAPNKVIPAVGAVDGQEYERTLVSAELIREVSSLYAVDAQGELTPESGSPC